MGRPSVKDWIEQIVCPGLGTTADQIVEKVVSGLPFYDSKFVEDAQQLFFNNFTRSNAPFQERMMPWGMAIFEAVNLITIAHESKTLGLPDEGIWRRLMNEGTKKIVRVSDR